MIPVQMMLPKLEQMPKRASAEGAISIEFVQDIPNITSIKNCSRTNRSVIKQKN